MDVVTAIFNGSMGPYTATTRSVEITVQPEYMESQSSPPDSRYVFAYHIRIRNTGQDTVQLLNRHWKITDAKAHTEEVSGPGVIGEQPVLHANESFNYTSFTPLTTPSGIMRGSYEMINQQGERFWAMVPAFSLDVPGQVIVRN